MLWAVTEPWMEKVDEVEPCDWCGRPGVVRQHDYYGPDGRLQCRNPSLCNVCVVFWHIPGDVEDAFYEAAVKISEAVEEPMESVLYEKWRAKVQRGLRQPG